MKRLVLVGAGHTHISLLAQSHRLLAAGIQPVLVAPGSFWYGARQAGLFAGTVALDELRMPLSHFCSAHGAILFADRAIGLDSRHRRIWLAGGRVIEYDRASLNVGRTAELAPSARPDNGLRVWNAASMKSLADCCKALAADCVVQRRPRVAVIGADRHAVAIAAGLTAGFGGCLRLTLYIPGRRLLPEAPAAAGRWVARHIVRRGVDLVFDTAIEYRREYALHSADGRRFAAEHAIVAADYQAAPLVAATGLASGVEGFHVNARLQSPADDRVFASGGCALRPGRGLLPVVDFAHQARVLGHNLVASMTRRPYQTYNPRRHIELLDLSDDLAVAWYGRLWWRGKMAARVKQRHDSRFMKELSAAPAAASMDSRA